MAASTTGDDQDADGYTVMLDGTEKAAIGANGSVNLTSVEPGSRSVSLSGVAENCAVGGEHPRSVSVAAGATAQAAFEVSCMAAVGSIEVTVATTGDTPEATDPDGYALFIDGVSAGAIDTNGTLSVAGISTGRREIELRDLLFTCSVSNGNPQTVNVPLHGTATASFDVTCQAPPQGRIAFGSRRTGQDVAYTMSGAGADVTQVTESPETAGTYGVYKLSPDGSKLAYVSHVDDTDIWVANTDGSGQIRLTENSEGGRRLDWSPDGSRIVFGRRVPTDPACDAFVAQCGIDVINVDGTGRITLSPEGQDPDWSPDGSRILFRIRDEDTGNQSLWLVNPDGSGLAQVTEGGDYVDASWSPDGSLILFWSHDDSGPTIRVLDADGTDEATLAEGITPVWSPDGSKVAFLVDGLGDSCAERRQLRVMSMDGTGASTVTSGFCVQDPYAWSPDGQWIAFWTYGPYEIYVVPTDGNSEPLNITNDPGEDWLGSWGP